MNWFKSTIVDVAVTVCIVLAAFVEVEWARWVIWIYTPFILLLKVGALFAPPAIKKAPSSKKQAEVPEWFFHLLYGANVLLLLVAGWWLVAAGWAAIWVVSYVAARRK